MTSAYAHAPSEGRRLRIVGDTAIASAVSASHTIAVHADPGAVCGALQSLDLPDRLTRALGAAGLAARFALAPTLLSAPRGATLRIGLVWRVDDATASATVDRRGFDAFAAPGHVKASWEIRVDGSGDDHAFLTVRTILAATDGRTRARLLDSWSVTGALADALARRTAAAARALAESDGSSERLAFAAAPA